MSQAIIQVEGIGKRYRIGGPKPTHFALRDVIAGLPARTLSKLRGRHLQQEFWALQDIDLEIAEGDVVGLVGRNGAGKSTLLKILSRIVEPTTGRGVLRGHVSSLLEVGTGFHFELTGRENIFLNGAILGMRRREIQAKFDEIVEFSEIEKFIDTPVKFYSSGMYVRLAFSVAAHLEPDILIIDEVLSVGDDRFQRKSLAKMSSVARSGRTVIFVSHNMSAVSDLCNRGVLLQDGRLLMAGPVGEVVQAYLRQDGSSGNARFERAAGDPGSQILAAVTLRDGGGEPRSRFNYGESLRLRVETRPGVAGEFGLEVRMKSSGRQAVAYLSSWIADVGRFRAGETIEIAIPALQLVADTYTLDFICRVPPERELDSWADEVTFELTSARPGGSLVDILAAEKLGAVIVENAVFERG